MPENLHECQTLCHDFKQHDPDTIYSPTLKELEKYNEVSLREDPEAGSGKTPNISHITHIRVCVEFICKVACQNLF